MQLPIYHTLKNNTTIELDRMHTEEIEAVRQLFNRIVLEGTTYPQNQPLSPSEFATYWSNYDGFVVRTTDTSVIPRIIGAFFIKPNFPGRCSHICNAGFIVAENWRGLGLGRWMGESMLKLAGDLGYEAVMFNLVFATNIPSLRLWESLGFMVLGKIPQAVRFEDGKMVDAVMMYRKLDNKVVSQDESNLS